MCVCQALCLSREQGVDSVRGSTITIEGVCREAELMLSWTREHGRWLYRAVTWTAAGQGVI